MKEILRNLFTESDNQTHDVVRVLAALTIIAFIVFAGVAVFKTGVFDPQAFGLGSGGLFGGLGAAMGLKKESGQ